MTPKEEAEILWRQFTRVPLKKTQLWIGHCTRCAFKVSGRTGDPALTEALCDHIDYVHEPAEQAA